jgi:uncharacterized protein YecT (DUF1311 family)
VTSDDSDMFTSRILRRGIITALVFWPLLAANAQDCSHSPDQRAWDICTANEAELSGRRLERLLAEISSGADSARRVQLETIQRQWKTFRDSDCRWQADAFAGGSIQPVVYSQCITAVTEGRIAELKLQLCEGFGVRGPCAASRKFDLPSPKG